MCDNNNLEKKIEEAKEKLKLLEAQRRMKDNPRYQTIVNWGTTPSICDGLVCLQCIFDNSPDGCIVGRIGFLMDTAKAAIDKNGGSLRKS